MPHSQEAKSQRNLQFRLSLAARGTEHRVGRAVMEGVMPSGETEQARQ